MPDDARRTVIPREAEDRFAVASESIGEHLRVKLAGVVGQPLPQKMTALLAELRRRTDQKSIR
ncbi:hypothetical protein [Methylocystis suflitae]|uniref:hypothetical protein n=1 Tax=Methylocystis suflitae TaxID=2951405 RepID=UPI0021097E2E|nr:hypothetical protein [Methylocystis suflitae]MCQ4188576.1 hypothetical protein [Methylocystis suflitae]